MEDQKFVVGYRGGSEAIPDRRSIGGDPRRIILKITGSKGTLWVSAESFVYAFPAEMMVPKRG